MAPPFPRTHAPPHHPGLSPPFTTGLLRECQPLRAHLWPLSGPVALGLGLLACLPPSTLSATADQLTTSIPVASSSLNLCEFTAEPYTCRMQRPVLSRSSPLLYPHPQIFMSPGFQPQRSFKQLPFPPAQPLVTTILLPVSVGSAPLGPSL